MYLRLLKDKHGNLHLFFSTFALLAVFVVLLAYFIFSQKKQSAYAHQCRTLGLESQQILADGMNELIAMNAQAKRLQKNEARALKLLRLAKTPKAYAIAQAYYRSVKAEQFLFSKKQKSTIDLSENRANLYLKRGLRKYGFKSLRRLKIYLRPTPLTSSSPVYTDFPGFKEKQKFRMQWAKNKEEKENFKGECIIGIDKEKKWHPKLIVDKV